jgi:hypothetical protein
MFLIILLNAATSDDDIFAVNPPAASDVEVLFVTQNTDASVPTTALLSITLL